MRQNGFGGGVGGEEGGGGPGNPIHPKLSSIKGKLSGCTQQHIVAR